MIKFIWFVLCLIGICIVFPGIGAVVVSLGIAGFLLAAGGILMGTLLYSFSKMFRGE